MKLSQCTDAALAIFSTYAHHKHYIYTNIMQVYSSFRFPRTCIVLGQMDVIIKNKNIKKYIILSHMTNKGVRHLLYNDVKD